jgi:FkbM family methyltransferase
MDASGGREMDGFSYARRTSAYRRPGVGKPLRLKTSTKLAVASGISRCLLALRRLAGLGSEVEVIRGGIRWRLDLTEGVDLAIYLSGHFESRTVRVFRGMLRPGDTAIDVGANIGANTLELARCVGPDGRVVAFEPTGFALERLCRNVSLNPELARRVIVEHAYLTAEASPAPRLHFYSSWPLGSDSKGSLHQRHGGRLKSADNAARWTLDRYVEVKRLSAVRLIKLDVDGSERQVLTGAKQTLERFRPSIIVEIAPYVLDEEEGALEGVVNLLRDLGYGFTDIASGKRLQASADELRHAIPDGAGINVLAENEEIDRSVRNGARPNRP